MIGPIPKLRHNLNARQAREEGAAAVARGEAAAVRVVAAIVGDFIAPSLLSCLDQGRGTWILRSGV